MKNLLLSILGIALLSLAACDTGQSSFGNERQTQASTEKEVPYGLEFEVSTSKVNIDNAMYVHTKWYYSGQSTIQAGVDDLDAFFAIFDGNEEVCTHPLTGVNANAPLCNYLQHNIDFECADNDCEQFKFRLNYARIGFPECGGVGGGGGGGNKVAGDCDYYNVNHRVFVRNKFTKAFKKNLICSIFVPYGFGHMHVTSNSFTRLCLIKIPSDPAPIKGDEL